MTQPAGFSFTTTAQDIVSEVSQDLRNQLASSGSDANILLDYVNRTQLKILRLSRWPFTLSPIERFITELEQTDYWIGPTAGGPAGSVDTGLNLNDVFRIRADSVYDRSNYKRLLQTQNAPNASFLSDRTGQSRPGLPGQFRSDPTNPNLFQIYPSPKNDNNSQPVPESPICTSPTMSGALLGRIYYVSCTFLDSEGNEGTASDTPTRVWVPAGQIVTVLSPKPYFTGTTSGATYAKYNVYAAVGTAGNAGNVAPNNLVLQSVSPVAVGTNWTEPVTGLVTGTAAPPLTSNLEPLNGYIIEFRYYQARPQVTALNTVLSIPDDYKDVVKAGVNVYAAKLAERMDDIQFWMGLFKEGVGEIVADKWRFPAGFDYIQPDIAAITGGTMGTINEIELFNS